MLDTTTQKKVCNKCKLEKTLEDFHKRKNRHGNDYIVAYCKICKNIQDRSYHKNNIQKRLFAKARLRAKNKGREFHITMEDIQLPEYCPILGIKLEVSSGRFSANSYTIDRIDSDKGYVKGNVHVISYRANMLKNDASLEELERIVEWMKRVG